MAKPCLYASPRIGGWSHMSTNEPELVAPHLGGAGSGLHDPRLFLKAGPGHVAAPARCWRHACNRSLQRPAPCSNHVNIRRKEKATCGNMPGVFVYEQAQGFDPAEDPGSKSEDDSYNHGPSIGMGRLFVCTTGAQKGAPRISGALCAPRR